MKNIFSSRISYPEASWPILWLRIAGGGFMLAHGVPKLMKLFGDAPIKFADPIGLGPVFSLGLAVFSEFLCAIFILVGFKTRAATIPLIITMLVAALIHHWPDAFSSKEKGLLYLAIYFALFHLGSGKYSVDHVLAKK